MELEKKIILSEATETQKKTWYVLTHTWILTVKDSNHVTIHSPGETRSQEVLKNEFMNLNGKGKQKKSPEWTGVGEHRNLRNWVGGWVEGDSTERDDRKE